MKNELFIRQLFIKYLDNQCTVEEVSQLANYFGSEQHEAILRSLILNELGIDNQNKQSDKDTEATLSKIRTILVNEIRKDSDEKSIKWISYSRWFRISAIWLLLIGVTALLILRYRNEIRNYLQPVKFLTIVSKPGQHKYLTLSDGSKIWLSPSSALEYPDQFNGNLREVKLEGEAFFEVAKDKKHPFIIQSGRIDTRVVGTSFDVKAYKSQIRTTVTVVTGIVKVSSYDISHIKHNEVTLKPNQQCISDINGNLESVNYPYAKEMLKRKVGIISYNGVKIQDVVSDLSNYYNIPIVADNKSKKCLCYGEFDTNKPITIALAQLSAAINAQVFIRDGKYFIEGGCED